MGGKLPRGTSSEQIFGQGRAALDRIGVLLAARLQRRDPMPTRSTIEKARRDARKGKSPSTQAGEFVHEEIEHVRQGKHGARSAKQAIAIGLSKARRAGVKLPPPAAHQGTVGAATRRKAKADSEAGQAGRKRGAPSLRRSRAATKALKRSGSAAASPRSLSRQAKAASRRRTRPSAPPRSGKRAAQSKARSKAV